MRQIWVYTWTTAAAPTMPDITGFDVQARDGEIGTVEECVNENGEGYVVVDTGWWIFGKKRMIPAGAIDTIDADNRRINVKMTKDEIKDAPDYDEVHRDDESVRRSHEEHYGRYAGAER